MACMLVHMVIAPTDETKCYSVDRYTYINSDLLEVYNIIYIYVHICILIGYVYVWIKKCLTN